MGLLDYYKQFEGMSEEEVNSGLRDEAAERKRDQYAKGDAPREVVCLSADPKAGERNWPPAKQAADDHSKQDHLRKRVVDPLPGLAAALGQCTEPRRCGAGSTANEKSAGLAGIGTHILYVRS